jgi:hypothetical protein
MPISHEDDPSMMPIETCPAMLMMMVVVAEDSDS